MNDIFTITVAFSGYIYLFREHLRVNTLESLTCNDLTPHR